jgi:putative transposase
MVRKTKRKINNKTARSMMTWSHYRFRETLKFHCQKRGVRLHIVTEEYTSKTCSKCGKIHSKLGGNKVFTCPDCGHKIIRDWNGAVNIALKTLSSQKGRLDSTELHDIC